MYVSADAGDKYGHEKPARFEDDMTDALREFADWIYAALAAEHDWLTSDETVAENIVANEYEVTAEGRIV